MIAYDRLSQIIPPDQALANKALNVSLLQITGIQNMDLPTFAASVTAIDNLNDLNIINALSVAVPPAVANYYINNLGIPTRPSPNLKIVDILGTPSGYIHTNALTDTVAQLSTMNTAYLQSVYETMLAVVQGDYTTEVSPGPPPVYETIIPSGTPGTGTYDTQDEAILALIAIAQTTITGLQSSYPNQCTAMNTDSTAMANQIVTERTQQSRANLNFNDLIANDKNSVYGFIFSLPGYGNDITPNGTREYLTNVSDPTTQTGQAVIGALREGQDQTILNSAGIGTNSVIPL